MVTKYYIEEFYKLTIQSGHRELSKEKVAQYVNSLRFNIQDEVGMLKIDSFEDAYQYTLKDEDQLKRKSHRRKEKLENSAQAKLSVVEDEPKPLGRLGGQAKVNLKVNIISMVERDIYILNLHRGIVVGKFLW